MDRRRDVRTSRLGWLTARFTKHEIRRTADTVAAVGDLRHPVRALIRASRAADSARNPAERAEPG